MGGCFSSPKLSDPQPMETVPTRESIGLKSQIGQEAFTGTMTLKPDCIGSTEPESFPFFCLPSEIRLLCYQYLIPEVIPSYPVPSRFYSEAGTELRADKQICTPGILAVSRRVHDEVINEFYGRGQFELTIVTRGGPTFDFLGYGHLFSDNNLPRVYYLIKHLKLTIKIKASPRGDFSDRLFRIYQQCFFHQKPSSLETVHIEIVVQNSFWIDHLRYHPSPIQDTIASYLGPLRAVRGLKKVTVLCSLESSDGWGIFGLPHHLVELGKDMILEKWQNALDELKDLMMLPVPQISGDELSASTNGCQ